VSPDFRRRQDTASVDLPGDSDHLTVSLENAMHWRLIAAVFAATFALPTSTLAQPAPGIGGDGNGARIRVTPFVGYLTGFTRSEDWNYQGPGGPLFLQSRVRVAGGEAGGLIVEAPLRGSVGVSVAVGYSSRGNTRVDVVHNDDAFMIDGHNIIFGRFGAAYRMPEDVSGFVLRRLGASVHAGVVAMHERPRNQLGPDDALDNATHFGVNLGVTGELPFAQDRLALQVGIEDNIMRWDNSALASLPYAYLNYPGESPDQTTVSASVSHAWLLRVGLSVRVR
jgi:hypothetical protein